MVLNQERRGYLLITLVSLLYLVSYTSAQIDRTTDVGHFSDTYGSSPCVLCKLGVYTTEIIALTSCAVFACTIGAVVTFGVSCAVCLAAVGVTTPLALLACQHSGACCPQGCGKGALPWLTPGPCCFSDEWCLDRQGRCCGADKLPCQSKSCCGPTQSCITAGLGKGSCCPDAITTCNNVCCAGNDDVCIGRNPQRCCSRKGACGDACCLTSAPMFDRTEYCADASRSKCCLKWEIYTNGVCCQPGQTGCAERCCDGTCNGDTCTITSEDCKTRGREFTGVVCQTQFDCFGAALDCLDGCCRTIPR